MKPSLRQSLVGEHIDYISHETNKIKIETEINITAQQQNDSSLKNNMNFMPRIIK